jgi:hypothetical protein
MPWQGLQRKLRLLRVPARASAGHFFSGVVMNRLAVSVAAAGLAAAATGAELIAIAALAHVDAASQGAPVVLPRVTVTAPREAEAALGRLPPAVLLAAVPPGAEGRVREAGEAPCVR